LTTDAQKAFIRGLANNDSYLISANDFSVDAMARVFSDEKTVRKISQEIFKSIAIEMPEKPTEETDSVMEKIKKRKQVEAEKLGIDDVDYDVYDEFVDDLKELKRADGSPNTIKNRENLKKENAVLQFRHADGTTQYIRITKTKNDAGNGPLDIDGDMNYGIEFETLNVVNNQLQSPQRAKVTYEAFEQFLKNHHELIALSSDEFS
jgi:hypothetical protein